MQHFSLLRLFLFDCVRLKPDCISKKRPSDFKTNTCKPCPHPPGLLLPHRPGALSQGFNVHVVQLPLHCSAALHRTFSNLTVYHPSLLVQHDAMILDNFGLLAGKLKPRDHSLPQNRWKRKKTFTIRLS